MSSSVARTASASTAYHPGRLLFVSSLALTMVGIGAAFRANIATDLQTSFLNPIDPAHSGEMLAQILGVPFLGFAFTIACRIRSA